jgi:hypothetical protein
LPRQARLHMTGKAAPWVSCSVLHGGMFRAGAWGLVVGSLIVGLYALAARASALIPQGGLLLIVLGCVELISTLAVSCRVDTVAGRATVKWLFRTMDVDLREAHIKHYGKRIILVPDRGPALVFFVPWWYGRRRRVLKDLASALEAAASA